MIDIERIRAGVNRAAKKHPSNQIFIDFTEALNEIERLRDENGKLLLRVTSAEARVKASVSGTPRTGEN